MIHLDTRHSIAKNLIMGGEEDQPDFLKRHRWLCNTKSPLRSLPQAGLRLERHHLPVKRGQGCTVLSDTMIRRLEIDRR